MATIQIKGLSARNCMAALLVEEYGADEARNRCSGAMLEAVERVIAERAQQQSIDGGQSNA